MSRTLVVYYSRTDHTRQVAESIASHLGADLEVIQDPTPRHGVRGYFRSGRDAWRGTEAPIGPRVLNPSRYDLVVIGSPIWNLSLSTPVRSYLRRERDGLPAVAFFLTCGGMGMDRVFRQMADAAGRQPVARLVVREKQLGMPEMIKSIEQFAADLSTRSTRVSPSPSLAAAL